VHEWARRFDIRLGKVLGGDLEMAALRAAAHNLRRLGHTVLARWDARALPLADGSVDRIVCNLPFGRQLLRPQEIGPLYVEVLRDCNRVLRPRGRAVLLVADSQALKQAATAVQWKPERQFRVRILGYLASMSVWRKD